MAFCTQCGARLPDNARFCPNCGAPVPTEAPTRRDPPVTPTPPVTPLPSQRIPPATPLTPPVVERVDEDEPRGGFGGKALAALAVIAALVVLVVIWQQRDGARPVAGNETVEAEPSPSPTPSETAVAEEPTPEPTPTAVATAPADLPTAAPAADTIVPVRSLDRAFNNDPRYSGQEIVGPLRLRGDVTTANPDDARPSIGLEGDGGEVIAYLDDDQRDAVALLEGGTAVRLTCQRARHGRGTTVLEGCRL